MSTEFIPEFRKSHDPDDTATRNLGIGGVLRRVNGQYANCAVTLSDDVDEKGNPYNPDAALQISGVAYDPTTQRVSFRVTGGTRGVKYLIRLRLFLTDSRQYDNSVWLKVRDH